MYVMLTNVDGIEARSVPFRLRDLLRPGFSFDLRHLRDLFRDLLGAFVGLRLLRSREKQSSRFD